MKLWGPSGIVDYNTYAENNILIYLLVLVALFIGLLLLASELHRQLHIKTTKAFCNI
jgi:hypothetical protein